MIYHMYNLYTKLDPSPQLLPVIQSFNHRYRNIITGTKYEVTVYIFFLFTTYPSEWSSL